jgi:hypothetical protein
MTLRDDLGLYLDAPEERALASSRSLLRWAWWWSALFLVAGAGALWWHAAQYLPFFSDDGFISLRYSQRLAEGEGLTWTAGERVEGYSNLLWVLLCAIPGALGFDWVGGARFVAVACVTLAMAAVLAAVRPRRLPEGFAAAGGAALFASTASVAVWTVGGLEAPLVAGLLAWGVVFGRASLRDERSRARWFSALCFGLLCWCRPDGFVWGAGVALGALIGWRRPALKYALTVGLATLLFVGVQLAFRWLYYDDLLPNTAYAKVALGPERFALGWKYFVDSLSPLAAIWGALVLLAVSACCERRLRGPAALLLVPAVAWTAYVILVGGDIFPAWRHWVPLTSLAAVAVAVMATRTEGTNPNGTVQEHSRTAGSPVLPDGRWVVTLAALALVGGFHDPGNWAREERWEWDGRPVGILLKQAFRDREPLLAVDAAGALPFFSELPTLDMLGLNDRFLAHHRPEFFGHGPVGHELGNADYYIERKPDIVCFAVPPCSFPAKYPEQRRFAASSDFRNGYAPVRLLARTGRRPLMSELWFAKEGRAGIRRAATRVSIPAYLLSGRSDGVHGQLEGDAVVTRWASRKKGFLSGIRLEPGTWQISFPGFRGEATVRVKQGENLLGGGPVGGRLSVTVPARRAVTVEVQAGEKPFAAGEILLERR